jgi:hypothetical protein
MTPNRLVDLALHIERTGTGIRGTVAIPGQDAESFAGWLELTASIARLLPAEAPISQPSGEPS